MHSIFLLVNINQKTHLDIGGVMITTSKILVLDSASAHETSGVLPAQQIQSTEKRFSTSEIEAIKDQIKIIYKIFKKNNIDTGAFMCKVYQSLIHFGKIG